MKTIDQPGNRNNRKNQQNNRFPARHLKVVAFCILIAFGIIIYLSRAYNQTADRYTFITQSFLNVLILAAIVVQALIYYVQWSAMARQSDLMAESLLETRKAADAAKKSADDANLTMKLSHYAYLEMVDWKIMAEADYSVGVAGTVKWGKTRSLHIWCRIINAGNIPATINTIETNFGPRGITEGPNATVIPLSVGYAYRYTINFDSVPSVEFKGNTKFGGAIRGKIRYTHFFERRIRHFHQLFSFDQTTNECEIVPMEGAGNNDEPDQDSEQSAN